MLSDNVPFWCFSLIFLPDNRPVPINTAHALRVTPSIRDVFMDPLSFRIPSVLPHRPLYHNFEFKSTRQPENFLSVFAMLVRDVVAAIFHVPKKIWDQTLSLVTPVPALPSAHHPNIATPGPSYESGRVSDDQVLESLERKGTPILPIFGTTILKRMMSRTQSMV